MAVELALNSAQAIGSGADQASFHVVQFVLIEFQLCLGQVDLLLQAVSGVVVLRRLDWPGQRVSCFRGSAEWGARSLGAFRS